MRFLNASHRDRAPVARRPSYTVESLEPRKLLSATIAAMPAIPGNLQDKLESRLWTTAQRLQIHVKNTLLRQGVARADSADRLQLDVHTTALTTIARRLRLLGARVTETVPELGVVEAFVPAGAVEAVARLRGVDSVSLPNYGITSVTSAGDSILKADKVRSQFSALGLDGTGIKVGVISDGATHRANVGAELPTITVDPTRPGNGDEGTAMLEIVHDLAPGAQLYFSGPTTSASMVSSINYLVAQGCKVIVDDVWFFGEGFFTDTGIANAAANAVSSGVVYVTAATNFGNQQHYQAQYSQSQSAFGGGLLHLFATGVDNDAVTISGSAEFDAFLEWSDPWGASGNNYDLYLIDSNSFATLAQSTTMQNGNDNPYERVTWTNPSGTSRQAQLWVVKKNGAASRELEMFTIGNSSLQYNTQGDALVSQQAVPGVLSAAAAPASNPSSIESFSSRGGSTVYTNFTTQTKTVRQSLDGTAIDGVDTQVGLSGTWPHNPFYGTSAAAPHAAAIAALLLQANPSLTPAQVLQDMADTATDIAAPGYDTDSGAGLYNALDAIYKLYTPAQVDLDSASDLGPSSTDNITNDNSPAFTGTVPAASYVRLYVDGVQTNSVQLAAGVTTYSITPVAQLLDGPHSVTIRVASSSSVLLANYSNFSAPLNIMIDTVAPTMLTSVFNFTGPAPQNLSYTFSESVVGSLQPGDLNLLNSTTSDSIDPLNVVFANSPATSAVFTFPGFRYGTLPDGVYVATIAASNITDIAGNPLGVDSTLNFFTLGGDANHDGKVDAVDLGILSSNWQGTGKAFAQGDSTYDGIVNINDLYVLGNNWLKDLFA